MKRFITLAAAALVALTPLLAQESESLVSSAKARKEAIKQARKASKLLRKDGYRTFGLGDPEAELEKYFLKIGEGYVSIMGASGPCMSQNLAKLSALANAANEWAVLEGGVIRGRLVSSASSLSGQQVDNLVASFERLVEKELRGELIPYATFYKERFGQYTARAYCIVDQDAAARARRHAMELALEEESLSETLGSMAAAWIDEEFAKQ